MQLTIEVLAIIISIVALFITLIGFFASLKFYRDGTKLQNSAVRILARIGAKTETIEHQVTGIFDKTLDAALDKKTELASTFNALGEQLNKLRPTVEEAVSQIQASGEQEKAHLIESIEEQIKNIKKTLKTTKKSTQDLLDDALLINAIGKHDKSTNLSFESFDVLTDVRKINAKGTKPYFMNLLELITSRHPDVSSEQIEDALSAILDILSRRQLVNINHDSLGYPYWELTEKGHQLLHELLE